jgi:serine/threonine protein kinase
MQLKIIDFGLSLHAGQTGNRCNYKRCGTLSYMAPEVFAAEQDKTYDEKCDIFSFGIIAHMMLLGWNPLKGKNSDCNFTRDR